MKLKIMQVHSTLKKTTKLKLMKFSESIVELHRDLKSLISLSLAILLAIYRLEPKSLKGSKG